MQIDAQERVAGIRMLAVRKFLQQVTSTTFCMEDAMRLLRQDEETVELLIEELLRRGMIEPTVDEGFWTTTQLGDRLARATAEKKIHRTTADRLLDGFLKRVEEINRSDYFLYRITRVVLFGSYLSDRQRLSDLDIAIAVECKLENLQERLRACNRRIDDAQAAGRRFPNHIMKMTWPLEEVKRHLRGGSHRISLNPIDCTILGAGATKTIYDITGEGPICPEEDRYDLYA